MRHFHRRTLQKFFDVLIFSEKFAENFPNSPKFVEKYLVKEYVLCYNYVSIYVVCGLRLNFARRFDFRNT